MKSKVNYRKLGCLVAIVVSVIVVTYAYTLYNALGACAYTDFGDAKSSDGKYVATLVNQDCGATSGMNWITILPTSPHPDLEHAPEVVDVPDGLDEHDMSWTGPRTLSIMYIKNQYSDSSLKYIQDGIKAIKTNRHRRWKDVRIELHLVP